MLDPFTALSLASAVIQFVDFGSKILVEGYGLYKSVDGQSEEDVELQVLTNDLETLSAGLAHSYVATTKEDLALQDLAKTCRRLAADLSMMLDDLKVSSKGARRTWESIRKSAKRIWKEKKFDNIQKQLERVKTQMNTHLLSIIRSNQSSVKISLDQLLTQNEDMHVDSGRKLSEAKNEVLTVLAKQQQDMKACKDTQKVLLQMANKSELELQKLRDNHIQALQAYQLSLQDLTSSLRAMRDEGAKEATTQLILASLAFEEIEYRHEKIREAHQDTFSWIFNEDTTPFRNWLSCCSGTFWITGRPGSGKSTLMKYIHRHRIAQTVLREWADRDKKQLYTASFFFWNSGYPLQRQLQGLLRSLLYQILKKCPFLIPQVFPGRWNSTLVSTDGTLEEPFDARSCLMALKTIFALDHTELPAKFCFFIDGLDEYEADGEHSHGQLVQDLNNLTESRFVKLCVSSRPWTEFKDAYSGNKERFLVMEQLTRPDMHHFVQSTLGQDARFEKLAVQNARAQKLITEILDKAEGVFLWVYLVVHSLKRGLDKHDDLDFLEKRLHHIPSDLEKYFDQILTSVEDVYKDHSARTFQLAINGLPLDAMAFWYLPVEMANHKSALQAPIKTITPSDSQDRIRVVTDRVNSWCRDLIEVKDRGPSQDTEPDPDNYRLEFIHRTVRDFLMSGTRQAWLQGRIAAAEFIPWDTLISLYLHEAKVTWSADDPIERFNVLAGHMMYFASHYEASTDLPRTACIEELNKVGTIKHSGYGNSASARKEHWFSSALLHGTTGDFLAYAISYGVTLYVKARLDQHPRDLNTRGNTPLLDFALHNHVYHHRLNPARPPIAAMVQVLLERGANPNEGWSGVGARRTPWHRFLQRCWDSGTSQFWPSALLLLQHGADTNIRVHVGYNEQTKAGYSAKFRQETAREVKTPVFKTVQQVLEKICDDYVLVEQAINNAAWRNSFFGLGRYMFRAT